MYATESWCFRVVFDPREYNQVGTLTKEDRRTFLEVAAIRIEQHAIENQLVSDRLQHFVPLLHIWQEVKGSRSVQDYLGRWFCGNPASASQFLDAFSNIALTPAIDDSAYITILKFVRANDIVPILQRAGLLDATNTARSAKIAQSFVSHILVRAGDQQSSESDALSRQGSICQLFRFSGTARPIHPMPPIREHPHQ